MFWRNLSQRLVSDRHVLPTKTGEVTAFSYNNRLQIRLRQTWTTRLALVASEGREVVFPSQLKPSPPLVTLGPIAPYPVELAATASTGTVQIRYQTTGPIRSLEVPLTGPQWVSNSKTQT